MEEKNVSVQLKPTDREDIRIKEVQAQEVLEGFKDFIIEDDDDLAVAVDCLKDIKRTYKEIEEKKESVTKPMNAALREIRSWFKPALDVLSATETLLKGRVFDYHRRQEEKSRKAMEEAAKAAVAGNFDAAHEASKGIVPLPASKGVTVGRAWDYSVVDLDLVPREFLCLDHSAVNIHIKAAGKAEPKPIPGLRFFEKAAVTVRS